MSSVLSPGGVIPRRNRRRRGTRAMAGSNLATVDPEMINVPRTLRTIDRLTNNQVYTQRLTLVQTVTGGVTGINYQLALDPSAFQDWTSFSAIYDEFRVLGGKVTYTPINIFINANLPMFCLFDNDSTPTLASDNECTSYPNCRVHNSIVPFVYPFKRPETATSPVLWRDVATPASSVGSISFFQTTGFTGTLNLGQTMTEILVQFRGRRS